MYIKSQMDYQIADWIKIQFKSLLKNKLFNLINVFCLLGVITFTISCKKFVEIDLPVSQLNSATVFEDASTANAAVAQLYIRLRGDVLVNGSSTGISNLLANYTDDIKNYGLGSNGEKFYNNNLLATEFRIKTIWQSSYNLIYYANSILEALPKSTGVAEQVKTSLEAEALFVRAYVHFYLLNLFGPIPYISTTNYQTNTRVKRMSAELVYSSIIADLTKAKPGLEVTYSSSERVRPNRGLIAAMLARVYLFNENWELAEKEANYVIDSTTLYSLENDLAKVFLKNSTGTIWQLKPTTEGENAMEARTFIFTAGPPPQGAINEVLLNAFEIGDQRKINWLGKITNSSGSWYFPYKYKKANNTGTSMEYSILFRLEEQYLIRSEARTRNNNLAGAKEDLNLIRNRAGLANTTANSETDLLQAILQERRIELFTELGHRFFDLKRTGKANNALNGIKSGWDPNDLLWPLPESELILNPNLKPQNPGY